MLQRFVYIFILYISFCTDKILVQIAFAADMYHLIRGKEFGENAPYSSIYGDRPKAASDHKDHRPIGRQAGIIQSGQAIAFQKFPAVQKKLSPRLFLTMHLPVTISPSGFVIRI